MHLTHTELPTCTEVTLASQQPPAAQPARPKTFAVSGAICNQTHALEGAHCVLLLAISQMMCICSQHLEHTQQSARGADTQTQQQSAHVRLAEPHPTETYSAETSVWWHKIQTHTQIAQ